jgi:hypothetical protein
MMTGVDEPASSRLCGLEAFRASQSRRGRPSLTKGGFGLRRREPRVATTKASSAKSKAAPNTKGSIKYSSGIPKGYFASAMVATERLGSTRRPPSRTEG